MFLLGLGVGAFGTLVGVGGGFILIPIFILFMPYTPQQAIGTSLAIVFLNAISGTVAYVRQKKVYYDAAVRFALATVPGAILGSYFAHYFTSRTFNITFGVLLLFISVLLYLRSSRKSAAAEFDKETFRYNRPLGIFLSLIIGFLSSILGIGGGIIHVPAMVMLLGFPTHIATATSHFVLAISSFFGVISHYILGNVLLAPALTIGLGALIGAQYGARLSKTVKSRPILICLAVAMFMVGIRLILK